MFDNGIKITNFSMAMNLGKKKDKKFKYDVYHTDVEFASPEAAAGRQPGFEHDMWSIGVITYILLTGKSPFFGKSVAKTIQNIKIGTSDQIYVRSNLYILL